MPLMGPTPPPELHVMSYNIRRRMTNLNPVLADRWPHRQPLLKQLLEEERPSILGVQEALPEQATFVRHALGEQYRSIGHGREKNGRGEGCPIFYDRERVRLIDFTQTMLSDTPDAQGSSTWGNRTPRVIVDATFADVATETRFHFINTHFDNRSRTSRLRSADRLRDVALVSGLPTIITGDFNTDANSEVHTALLGDGRLVDTWDAADRRVTEVWGTFLDYHPPKHDHKRIDWILTTPGVSIEKVGINTTRFDRGWASDHAAVQAVIRVAR
ncbi:endonuclease/exonuclease/phosphatase family protein [Lacisediminihabitans changchengi]|uniref:Endonuclease/exonuclease/phosphatase family protein n=1 Tax=Lacisediminihabitans changchengi TaxID=2787634 RepID=A0A934SS51_9MICO|nr:endonuclease/exonuclease/phosphatase family protein [Lacisediminihabitans changchengi]MBK4347129.1 endonuclease/exonuclease/phosphatase family protein [Lacisediminihabitans changchengi]